MVQQHLLGKWDPKIGPMGPGPLDFLAKFEKVDEISRESLKIYESRSGSMREGPGSQKNALKIKNAM